MAKVSRQVISFGAVGVINTIIDFTILNILHLVIGFPRIPSNIVSSTTAMLFSFFANKRVVFNSKRTDHAKQMVLFFAVTLSGLYILQNSVIYLVAEMSTVPGDFFYSIVEAIGLDGVFTYEFVITNAAKVLATACSMVWNYLLYREIVFKKHEVYSDEH